MTATSRNGVGAFAVGYPVRLAAALGGLARLAEDEG
jgi:hypothetical protein